jgi:hypothetical protein
VEKKNGFVAMLDILGFSDQVAMDSEIHGLDMYVETVLSVALQSERLKVILFSDTVVFYTLDDTNESFDLVLKACSQSLYALLKQDIPMRGAIAYGSFRRSDQTSGGAVIAGRPIIEAHHYESQQQWIGVMLAPSVWRHMPDLFSLPPIAAKHQDETSSEYFRRMYRQARLQLCREIPLHPAGGSLAYFHGLAVVPTSPAWNEIKHTEADLEEVLGWLDRLKFLAPDARSQAKYTNAIRFLGDIRDQWRRALEGVSR